LNINWSDRPKTAINYITDDDFFEGDIFETKNSHIDDQPNVIYHGKYDQNNIGAIAIVGLVFGLFLWFFGGSKK